MQNTVVPVVNVIVDVTNHKDHEWEKLEKILLSINGATIALTVSLFTSRVTTLLYPALMKWSWGFLMASMIFLVASYVFADCESRILLSKLDLHSNQSISTQEYRSYRAKWTIIGVNITNYAALATTIIGMLLLIIFGAYNVG